MNLLNESLIQGYSPFNFHDSSMILLSDGGAKAITQFPSRQCYRHVTPAHNALTKLTHRECCSRPAVMFIAI